MRSLQVECRRTGPPRTESSHHRDRARGVRLVKAEAAAGDGSDVGRALYVKGPVRAGQCIEHGADVIVRASPSLPRSPQRNAFQCAAGTRWIAQRSVNATTKSKTCWLPGVWMG
jgi:hypothetical protein